MANEIKLCVTYTWEEIGHVEKGSGDDLKFDCEITELPGIYKLVVNECREIYVGEGQSLKIRLNNYAKAGWYEPATVEYTNRRVQGWLVKSLRKDFRPEIYICTKAAISFQNEAPKELDLKEKSNRLIVENLEIAKLPPNWILKNKKKQGKDQGAASIHTLNQDK